MPCILLTKKQKRGRIEHLNRYMERLQTEVIDPRNKAYKAYVSAVDAGEYDKSNKLTQIIWERSEAHLEILRAANEKRKLIRELYPEEHDIIGTASSSAPPSRRGKKVLQFVCGILKTLFWIVAALFSAFVLSDYLDQTNKS